jgi:16S rRNA (cytosine1402-N4)-methyltransferase
MISLRENLDKQHVSVLKEEILSYAEPICSRPQSLVIDCTLGLGGHSEAILERYKNTRVIGIDKDESVLSEVNKRLEKKFPRRFTSFNHCFSQ